MKYDKLNLTQEEFDICIKKFAQLNGFEVKHEPKGHEIHYFIIPPDTPPATIRFQVTKTGISLSSALGKNQTLGDDFLIWMRENGYTDRRVLGAHAVYFVPQEKRDDVRRRIEDVVNAESFAVTYDVNPQNCDYRCRITNNKHDSDSITVSQFSSGRLVIQGRAWFVWDQVCPAIEEELGCEVRDILVRIVGDEAKAQRLKLFTPDDITKASESACAKLGFDAYKYLNEYDRKLLDSTEVLISSGIELADYFPFIAPVCRAIEGYLKQVLVTKNAFRSYEVRGSQFTWKRVFVCRSDRTWDIVPEVAQKLGSDKNSQLKGLLLEIHAFIQRVRNHYFHSSPGLPNTISDQRTALGIIEEAYRLIRESYSLLFL
jgi:hypothetical protein